MKKHLLTRALTVLALFSLAACSIQIVPYDTTDNGAAQDAAAGTALAETQVALIIQMTLAAMGNPPPTTVPGNNNLLPTAMIPSNTPLPTATSTLTLSPTSSVPMLTVSVATNCRTGPGTAYPTVGDGILPNEIAEVLGRGTNPNYWIVRNPGSPSVVCWVWGEFATISGNIGALPVFTPPPTPTPVATNTPTTDYSLAYLTTTTCAPQYAFRFYIENTGGVTWESIQIVVTDNTTATTTTHSGDTFRAYNGCTLEMENEDLGPGEGSNITNVNPGQFNHDPTGHNITAVFKLCTLNGLAGTCINRSISFTP